MLSHINITQEEINNSLRKFEYERDDDVTAVDKYIFRNLNMDYYEKYMGKKLIEMTKNMNDHLTFFSEVYQFRHFCLQKYQYFDFNGLFSKVFSAFQPIGCIIMHLTENNFTEAIKMSYFIYEIFTNKIGVRYMHPFSRDEFNNHYTKALLHLSFIKDFHISRLLFEASCLKPLFFENDSNCVLTGVNAPKPDVDLYVNEKIRIMLKTEMYFIGSIDIEIDPKFKDLKKDIVANKNNKQLTLLHSNYWKIDMSKMTSKIEYPDVVKNKLKQYEENEKDKTIVWNPDASQTTIMFKQGDESYYIYCNLTFASILSYLHQNPVNSQELMEKFNITIDVIDKLCCYDLVKYQDGMIVLNGNLDEAFKGFKKLTIN